MNESEKKKIEAIVKKLEKLQQELYALIGTTSSTHVKDSSQSNESAKELLENINSLSSENLELRLKEMSHNDLGIVFKGVGGSSIDRRKPKAWLIERILWLAKDFSKGHKSIRES